MNASDRAATVTDVGKRLTERLRLTDDGRAFVERYARFRLSSSKQAKDPLAGGLPRLQAVYLRERVDAALELEPCPIPTTMQLRR